MKIKSVVPCAIFTICCGCSDGDALFDTPSSDASPDSDSDAGVDVKTKDAATDGKKDAPLDTKMDAFAPDSPADVSGNEKPAPEAGLDAEPDATEEPALPDCSDTLLVGDLIKGASTGVYYYGEDCKRHLFPNENTFYSWLTVDDFNLVKTITDAELNALLTGKDVTIRPGTHLVKIQSDPKTYAVTDCAQLHWIESEAIIAALYGADWAARIVDIPDSIWNQYTLSAPITAPIHPDGQLIAYTGDPNSYVVMGGSKRKIASTAAFNANHWQAIYTVTTAIPYGNGVDVANSEPNNFWRIVCP